MLSSLEILNKQEPTLFEQRKAAMKVAISESQKSCRGLRTEHERIGMPRNVGGAVVSRVKKNALVSRTRKTKDLRRAAASQSA